MISGAILAGIFFSLPAPGSAAANGKIDRVNDDSETTGSSPVASDEQARARDAFDQAVKGNWSEVFFDSGTGDWEEKWFLDGEIGAVTTSEDGMQLTAGPRFGNDAHHMVLWTKNSFEGDLKIEFDYTRLDFETRTTVNILYIQATGSGEGPYEKDIAKWRELRRVPAMQNYFNHMHTYHISYAAPLDPVEEGRTAYIRGRRYMPEKGGLKGTDLVPDYFPPKELFAPGVPHRVTVIKRDRDLHMRMESPKLVHYCHFTNEDLPPVTEGRIGIRHMFTRSSLYKNFRVSQAD